MWPGDPYAIWLQKSSLDISTLWGARGVSGLDYTKVFEGWTPSAPKASGHHGNSELGTIVRERMKVGPACTEIGLSEASTTWECSILCLFVGWGIQDGVGGGQRTSGILG